MSRWLRCALIFLSLLGSGCAGRIADDLTVEAVSFAHPDEVVKGQGFMVLADRREFAVMAFVNAMGYDDEAQGQSMHPVRVKVRRLVSQNLAAHAAKVETWRQYYETRKLATFQYLDYALSLSAEYPFRRIRRDTELGYPVTAERLKDFPEILNDFWVTGGLDEIWKQVLPDYADELRKYDLARMERQMTFLWQYLRMPRHDTLTLVNVPDLLDTHFHAIGAHYENYYYTVESPGSHSYGLNIHEYLHSIVNPIVKARAGLVKDTVMPYYEAGKDKPIAQSYREPVCFTYECMVRALDHRLNALFSGTPDAEKRAEARVVQLDQDGLTLSLPFYRLLANYEQSDKPFDEFVPIMLARLPAYGR
ncbi:MAG: hypothetical protein RBS72_04955 [Sedimentisphaerales bacterium]|nr:hypothetical protein [Sedimentisphaerales bacterium]HNY77483.1 hypothetical protein [Sedimentisphaerales bacterium]HOC62887.1 hypothetical protein [Sedimentisphaerales bacterium]HOH63627.1 hypothetical protein [Sedimentisphaerales bacterium]HPY49244.1 hypothetical protein [Sedimentisphaerales bacterium]